MMNRLKSKSAIIAIIACFVAEVVFSDSLKLLLRVSVKTAPVCILLGGLAATFTALLAKKSVKPFSAFVLSVVYLLIIIFRFACNTSYLYNGALTPLVLVGAVILAIISAIKGIRGAGIYSALCYIPLTIVFVICCLLGGTDISFKYLSGIFSIADSGFLIGIAVSYSLFAPVILCAMFVECDNIRTVVKSGIVSTLLVTVMLTLAVGVFGRTAANYPSIIAEISKNVSVGKFFQRLEGFADASYIVAASAVITILGSMIGESTPKKKYKHIDATVTLVVSVSAGIISYISMINGELKNIMLTVTAFSGIAAIVLVLIEVLDKRRVASLACVVAICILCGCTSSREIENQTFVVITAFDGDRIHLVTENGSGKNMYTAETDSLAEAVSAVEASRSVSISLLQAEMLVIGGGSDCCFALSQALESDMPNSASVVMMEGDFVKLYDTVSNNYESPFDFVSAIQTSAKQSGYACEPASTVMADIVETGQATIGVLGEKGMTGDIIVEIK